VEDNQMSKEIKTVGLAEAKEQVKRVCTRLALLHLSFSRTIIKELGEEQGKRIIMKAIKEYGALIGREAKVRCAERGESNTPSNYLEDLPLYGMYDRLEVVHRGEGRGMRIHGCVMGRIWEELGESNLGRLYCYVDPAKYMAFNPNFKLVHIKAIPEGDDCCEFVIRPTTEQDRTDFEAQDTDWSQIDK
jgi:hypothetical protein